MIIDQQIKLLRKKHQELSNIRLITLIDLESNSLDLT